MRAASNPHTPRPALARTGEDRGLQWLAAGGIVSALGAATCCVVPFALFTAGIAGAWIGTLTTLAPYQPVFVGLSLLFLGAGYYRVYRRPAAADCDSGYCARPISRRVTIIGLFSATGIVCLAIAWPYILPLISEPVVIVK